MKLHSSIIHLFILFFLLEAAGFLLTGTTAIAFSFGEIAILIFCFALITLTAILIFRRGMSRDASARTMHIMVSTTVKFLLEMALALLWFFVAKKTSAASLLLFFILYLTFSVFSINLMLNTLKNKSL